MDRHGPFIRHVGYVAKGVYPSDCAFEAANALVEARSSKLVPGAWHFLLSSVNWFAGMTCLGCMDFFFDFLFILDLHGDEESSWIIHHGMNP